jgi:hypothetical protein
MASIRKEGVDQFRVGFAELARVKRGAPVQVDPFLIARAIALVMRECTVRSAAGRPILWNAYRMILARRDFELVRSLQGPLERDLRDVLAQEAQARAAELVGELRVTVVFDEADELAAGQGVVRVAFVPTEKLVVGAAGEMTVRLDGWAVAGEIASRASRVPGPPADTVVVDDATRSAADRCVLRWSGGEAVLAAGATVVVGRPHPGAPAHFVSLTGAGPKVNKQHLWIVAGASRVRIGRLVNANPVHVNGQPVAASQDIEVALPAEISLSRGELVLTVRRG